MTNREKYKEKKDAYDLMMTIRRRGGDVCPIKLVGADKPLCVVSEDGISTDCGSCIQRWLNEEAKI